MNMNILSLFITNVNQKNEENKCSEIMRKRKSLCFVLPSCLPLHFLSLLHSQCNCHENELLICFPKEFLISRKPDSRNTMVVLRSTNNFPGLHCLSKALFHLALIMWEMSLSKVSLLFFSHKDVRWRELEFPNMRERKLSPFLPSAWEFIQHVGNFLCLSKTKCALEYKDAICPQLNE